MGLLLSTNLVARVAIREGVALPVIGPNECLHGRDVNHRKRISTIDLRPERSRNTVVSHHIKMVALRRMEGVGMCLRWAADIARTDKTVVETRRVGALQPPAVHSSAPWVAVVREAVPVFCHLCIHRHSEMSVVRVDASRRIPVVVEGCMWL
jgi:hypothetical protein